MKKRKTKAVARRKPASAMQVPQHPLVAMAQAEPEVRRKRFYMMLARVLPHLSPDELSVIEPVLQRAYGRMVMDRIEEAIPS